MPEEALIYLQGVQKRQCIVLVPFYSDIPQKVRNLLGQLRKKDYEVWEVPGISAIDQARCHMAQSALNLGYRELMWLDADVLSDVSAFDRIRARNLPIVAGIYPVKDGTGRPCIDVLETTDLSKPLTEVRYAATGFLYTKAEVYENIALKLKLEQCSSRFGPLFPWFQPGPFKRRYLGEDFMFCERARQCGYRVMVDTTIRLQHIGMFGYTWNQAKVPNLARLPVIFSVIDNADLLPHFVRHYLDQGATEFIACVHPSLPLAHGQKVSQIMDEVGGRVHLMPEERFNGQIDSQFQDAIRRKCISPTDWYIIADLDELHEIPFMSLAEAVRRADEDGATVIAGEFRDRVTQTGTLPPSISDIVPIHLQFPMTARVTQAITMGMPSKVLAARGDIAIESGHHRHKGVAWTGRGWANHYKWWGPLLQKAKDRASSYKAQGLHWSNESELLVRHLTENDGNLNLSMAGMDLRRVEN